MPPVPTSQPSTWTLATGWAAGLVAAAAINPVERTLNQLANMAAVATEREVGYVGTQLVPVQDLIVQYHAGTMSAETLTALLAAHGVPWDLTVQQPNRNRLSWQTYVEMRRPSLSPEAYRTLVMWSYATPDQMRAALLRQGVGDPVAVNQFRALGMQPLSAAAAIDAAQARAWDDTWAARWGLDLERPGEYDLWMIRNGLNYRSDGTAMGTPTLPDNSAGNALWRDHWRVLDLPTLAACLHVFREGQPDQTIRLNPNLAPLTTAEVDHVFSSNGIAPKSRYYYEELMYRRIDRRDLVLMVEFGNFTRQQCVDVLRDSGYKAEAADLVAGALIAQRDERQARPLLALRTAYWRKLIDVTVAGYEAGTLSKQNAITYLWENGVGLGQDPNPLGLATIILNQAEITLQTQTVRKVTERARADWLAGRTSLDGAAARLRAAGVQPDRLAQTLQVWQLERGEGRVVLATREVLRLLREGFLSADDAANRLDNLGWAAPDKLLLLAEVQGQVEGDRAKALRAEQLAEAKAAAEFRRLLAAGARQQQQLRAKMEKLRPPAKVLKWMQRGIWTRQQVVDWLALIGYDQGTINAMVAEAEGATVGQPATLEARQAKVAANLRRLTPVAKVLKWYKDGIRSEDWVRKRLALLGYDADSIQAYLDDAKHPSKGSSGGSSGQLPPPTPPAGPPPA